MKKKRSAGKIIGIVLICICLVLLLLMLAAFIYFNSLLNKIDRNEITGDPNLSEEEIYEAPTVDMPDSIDEIEQVKQEFEEAQKIEIAQSDGVDNILLIGADRRSMSENGRSDSVILVSLNHDTGKIHLTSFMRAMYVCIPRSDGNVWGMLNAAYSWGGPNLLIDTIELNFRIKIDRYVIVDFTAFETAIDMVGGVELNLTAQEASVIQTQTGAPTYEGVQVLDGHRALIYAQTRNIDNDFKRTSRQRTVITALLSKVPGIEINTLISMANEILPLVNTNLSNTEIMQYIIECVPIISNPNNISQRMLPVENESGETFTGIIYVNGREMYRVNFAHNIKELHDFINS